MTVQRILAKHYQPAGLAGSSTSAALERDLLRHAKWNAVAYVVLFVLFLIVLIAAGAMVFNDAREGRSVRTTVLAGAGITLPIILDLIRRTVREWSRADLMAVLCRRLDGSQLQAVIEKLIEPG